MAQPQVPPTHGRPIAHTLPQAPQLFGSLASTASQPSLEFALQSEKPALQVMPQAPPLQTAVALAGVGHDLAHIPQFSGSNRRSTQTLLQLVSGAPQLATHIPPTQTVPAAHGVPHIPQ